MSESFGETGLFLVPVVKSACDLKVLTISDDTSSCDRGLDTDEADVDDDKNAHNTGKHEAQHPHSNTVCSYNTAAS